MNLWKQQWEKHFSFATFHLYWLYSFIYGAMIARWSKHAKQIANFYVCMQKIHHWFERWIGREIGIGKKKKEKHATQFHIAYILFEILLALIN